MSLSSNWGPYTEGPYVPSTSHLSLRAPSTDYPLWTWHSSLQLLRCSKGQGHGTPMTPKRRGSRGAVRSILWRVLGWGAQAQAGGHPMHWQRPCSGCTRYCCMWSPPRPPWTVSRQLGLKSPSCPLLAYPSLTPPSTDSRRISTWWGQAVGSLGSWGHRRWAQGGQRLGNQGAPSSLCSFLLDLSLLIQGPRSLY